MAADRLNTNQARESINASYEHLANENKMLQQISGNKKRVIVEVAPGHNIRVTTYENNTEGWFKFARHYVSNWFSAGWAALRGVTPVKTYVNLEGRKQLLLDMSQTISELNPVFGQLKTITKDFGERFRIYDSVKDNLQIVLKAMEEEANQLALEDPSTDLRSSITETSTTLNETMDKVNNIKTMWRGIISRQNAHKEISEDLLVLKQLEGVKNIPDLRRVDLKTVADAFTRLSINRRVLKSELGEEYAREIDSALADTVSLISRPRKTLEEVSQSGNLAHINIAYTAINALINDPNMKKIISEFNKDLAHQNMFSFENTETDFNPKTALNKEFEACRQVLRETAQTTLSNISSSVNTRLGELQKESNARADALAEVSKKVDSARNVMNDLQAFDSQNLVNEKLEKETEAAPLINLLKDILTYYASAKDLGDAQRKELSSRIAEALKTLRIPETEDERKRGAWPITALTARIDALNTRAEARADHLGELIRGTDAVSPVRKKQAELAELRRELKNPIQIGGLKQNKKDLENEIKELESELKTLQAHPDHVRSLANQNKMIEGQAAWQTIHALLNNVRNVLAETTSEAGALAQRSPSLSLGALLNQVHQVEERYSQNQRERADFQREAKIIEELRNGEVPLDKFSEVVRWAQGRLQPQRHDRLEQTDKIAENLKAQEGSL